MNKMKMNKMNKKMNKMNGLSPFPSGASRAGPLMSEFVNILAFLTLTRMAH